jgi:hypothetical protein
MFEALGGSSADCNPQGHSDESYRVNPFNRGSSGPHSFKVG